MGRVIISRIEMDLAMTEEVATVDAIQNDDKTYQVSLEVEGLRLLSPRPFNRYEDVKAIKDDLVALLASVKPHLSIILVDNERLDGYMYGEVSEAQLLETRKTVRILWFNEIVVDKPASEQSRFYSSLEKALREVVEDDYVLWTIEEGQ